MATKLNAIEAKKVNHLYNYIAALIVIIGIALFYTLKINIWLKWTIVIAAILSAGAIFFLISPTGLNLHNYLQDARRELAKIVWPTRKEAIQFTWIVFLFVLILSLFLWLIDSSLSWLLYNFILGRNG